MRSIKLLSILLATASCTGRQPGDRNDGRSGRETQNGPSAVKIEIDAEELKRRVEATEVVYAAYKQRDDRIFGESFEDVYWKEPQPGWVKRISTGELFRYTAYNGGYPSCLTLSRGGELLRADVKCLFVDAPRDEPIYVVGRVTVQTGPSRGTVRDWTSEERHLIASFLQTSHEIGRVGVIASFRSNGHHEMADARQRLPKPRVSAVFDS